MAAKGEGGREQGGNPRPNALAIGNTAGSRKLDASMPGAPRRKSRLVQTARRLFAAVRRDLLTLPSFVGRAGFRPSLRSYDIALAGGRRRIHFRTAADGTGMLLIDATDVIHLNATAALLARLVLDGISIHRAATLLRRRFRGVDSAEAIAAADKVYRLIERVKTATDSCPTCALCQTKEAEQLPLFGAPVSAPYKADLALTYDCNNACRHCYNACPRGKPRATVVADSSFSPFSSSLSLSQWQRVLRRLAAIGVPHVIFTGGEPTLVEGLPGLIRAATQLGLVAGLNTNGRRLAEPRFAASLRQAGLDHLQITLQSHDRAVHNAMSGADSFDETVAGIRSALAAGLHTLTNTTLTRQNVACVPQTIAFLHSLGLRTFAMNGIIFAGGGCNSGDALPAESLAPVLAHVRDLAGQLGMRFLWYTPTEYCRLSPVELELGPRRCNAAEYSMCIDPSGNVLPCQSYDAPAGNILRDPWERIWQSELFRGFRRRTENPRAAGLPEQCWTCADLSVCGGGCKLERMHHEMAG